MVFVVLVGWLVGCFRPVAACTPGGRTGPQRPRARRGAAGRCRCRSAGGGPAPRPPAPARPGPAPLPPQGRPGPVSLPRTSTSSEMENSGFFSPWRQKSVRCWRARGARRCACAVSAGCAPSAGGALAVGGGVGCVSYRTSTVGRVGAGAVQTAKWRVFLPQLLAIAGSR